MNSSVVVVSLRVADLEMGYDRTAFTFATIEVVIEDGAPDLPRLLARVDVPHDRHQRLLTGIVVVCIANDIDLMHQLRPSRLDTRGNGRGGHATNGQRTACGVGLGVA